MNLNEAAAWLVDNREQIEETKEEKSTTFKSSTHVLLMADHQGTGGNLFYGSHVTDATKEAIGKLELL